MSLELKEQYEKVYAFCYFKVHNVLVAEDITQETFLKYFETTQYLEKGKKLAFLYTIARNCCIDYFRKNKHTEILDDLSELTVEQSEDSITVIAVRSAVSKLSSKEQEIVLLRYTNELGIGEIAEYLDISRFALYRKLNEIKRKLKQNLRKEDFYG
ncbi:RNA polymerase sigma factor [Sporosalibacterium faouarense]|uniref:RNA polymerase sigma factor n=1 Tax=Sporosalibacterium faouarense TaxID=516123 RepID=UPI00141D3A28|nr:RNA polymerase sigma factor [Sporosalibacterium faouarense]MTI47288.1 RNA polymerase sigma factor [Bacillota bacterium]